jgi:hypothetical protein
VANAEAQMTEIIRRAISLLRRNRRIVVPRIICPISPEDENQLQDLDLQPIDLSNFIDKYIVARTFVTECIHRL